MLCERVCLQRLFECAFCTALISVIVWKQVPDGMTGDREWPTAWAKGTIQLFAAAKHAQMEISCITESVNVTLIFNNCHCINPSQSNQTRLFLLPVLLNQFLQLIHALKRWLVGHIVNYHISLQHIICIFLLSPITPHRKLLKFLSNIAVIVAKFCDTKLPKFAKICGIFMIRFCFQICVIL